MDEQQAKPINPKDAIGSTKLPLHLWPAEATAIGCLGMLEGHDKYGFNNYIAGEGVIASIYLDAAERHLKAFASGEELTRDTGNFHLSNLLASIAIIVKARAHGKLIDDREFNPAGMRDGDLHPSAWPTTGYVSLVEFLTPWVKKIKAQFVGRDKPRHYTIADNPHKAPIGAERNSAALGCAAGAGQFQNWIGCRPGDAEMSYCRREPGGAMSSQPLPIGHRHVIAVDTIGGIALTAEGSRSAPFATSSGVPGDDQEADFAHLSFGGTSS
jgi:hypothetical protein